MPDPVLSNKLTILLGDGGGTEVFSWPCGATSRSVTFTNNTGEQVVMDCTDPLGLPAAIVRWTESQDTSISIAGRIDRASLAGWRAWNDTGNVRNIRVNFGETGANGGGYYQLPAIIQSFELGAEDKGMVTFTASIMGAGRRVWTAAA